MKPDDNMLMCLVTGEAPMGRLLRENFWFPATLSGLVKPGGAPERVKLLGEQFIAWRAHDGRLGFFDEACPHRRVSLALARNEDNALRCIFHGWKYSVTGEVLEVPTEPHNAEKFCKHVPLRHFPVTEAGGIVWAWLGSGEPAPLPDFEPATLPLDHSFATYQDVKYNWVQSVEGGMDAAHVAVLHQSWIGALSGGDGVLARAAGSFAPTYEFEDRQFGFRYAAVRNLGSGLHIRTNEFVAPWYCFICPETEPRGDRTMLINVPIDDVTTRYWTIRYNPYGPVSPSLFNPDDVPDFNPASWPPYVTAGPEQSWGQDREAMENGSSFTGFNFPTTEDYAVSESQGAIVDRSREFLSSGDLAVVRVRKILLGAVKEALDGRTPAIVSRQDGDYANVRPMTDIIEVDRSWKDMAV